jgi:hypothetical protein
VSAFVLVSALCVSPCAPRAPSSSHSVLVVTVLRGSVLISPSLFLIFPPCLPPPLFLSLLFSLVLPSFSCVLLLALAQVNGSSHTALAPLWMDTLGKRRLTAMACSRRSGRLTLEVVRGDDGAEQVHIGGTVAFFMDGTIYLR